MKHLLIILLILLVLILVMRRKTGASYSFDKNTQKVFDFKSEFDQSKELGLDMNCCTRIPIKDGNLKPIMELCDSLPQCVGFITDKQTTYATLKSDVAQDSADYNFFEKQVEPKPEEVQPQPEPEKPKSTIEEDIAMMRTEFGRIQQQMNDFGTLLRDHQHPQVQPQQQAQPVAQTMMR